MTEQALSGLLVVELGTRLAAAISGNLLMQLGATVVSIETDGDAARYDFKGAHRPVMVAGKLSFAPRAGVVEDELMLVRLIERADLVLTSSDVDNPLFRKALEAAKNTIVCDITAFGKVGALAGQPASEFEIQALTGVSDTTGFAEGPPTPILLLIVSHLTGVYATIGVLSALYARQDQGIVQNLDVSLFDCGFISLNTFLASTLTDPKAKKTRLGNRHPTVAPWNTYRTSDGWVLICAGNWGQWERLCQTIGRPELAGTYPTQGDRIRNTVEIDQAIEAWTSTRTAAECVNELIRATVACGPIAPVDLYPREENLDYRRMIRELFDPQSGGKAFVPGSPLRLSETPGKAPSQIPARDGNRDAVARLIEERRPQPVRTVPAVPKRPLSGIKVIELGQYTTAPLCAKHLAHLGAEVIKIERPGGDESRTWPPHIDGRSITFRLNNADKRSLTLDLTREADQKVLHELARQADVLVENMKPGALAKFGLPPKRALELNPRLVYCSISGFGADSLYPTRPAFDMVIQAMSGFMSTVSDSDMPLKTGISSSDTTGGIMAAVAILAALNNRQRTGRGQYIDMSMQDVTAWLTQIAWNGKRVRAPAIIECSDGYVFAEDHEDAGPSSLSKQELASRLREQGVKAFPVLSLKEATQLPHSLERRIWFYLQSSGFEWPMLDSPLRLEKTPPFVSHIAPEPNADARAILREHGIVFEPEA